MQMTVLIVVVVVVIVVVIVLEHNRGRHSSGITLDHWYHGDKATTIH